MWTAAGESGDCRKTAYRIAKDVRLPARSADRSIAGQRDCRHDADGGREDERGGMGFEGNRLTDDVQTCPQPRQLSLGVAGAGLGEGGAAGLRVQLAGQCRSL